LKANVSVKQERKVTEQTIESRTAPIRGAIRTIIESSTDGIYAGGEFSIFVRIQNPFEVPLTLVQISAHIPTEFIDLDQYALSQQIVKLQQELGELQMIGRQLGMAVPAAAAVAPKKSHFSLRSIKLSLPFMDVEYKPGSYVGPAIARDISSQMPAASVKLKLPLVGSAEIKRTVGKNDNERPAVKEQVEQDINSYQNAINTLQRVQPVLRDLQPGNSTTRVFTLRTRNRVWFKPSAYRLQIEIEYEIAGTRNLDTVDHQIQVKASLTSVILGSVFGASGGWAVKELGAGVLDTTAFLRLLVSIVLAAMTVVLFARKKDVQPLIAVEDFWGGVAIGFIAAYVGPKIIENIVPSGAGGTPRALPVPTPG